MRMSVASLVKTLNPEFTPEVHPLMEQELIWVCAALSSVNHKQTGSDILEWYNAPVYVQYLS